MLSDNYETVTKQHFLPAKGSNGKDALPFSVIQKSESGFIRERPLTVPTVAEVRYLNRATVKIVRRRYTRFHAK